MRGGAAWSRAARRAHRRGCLPAASQHAKNREKRAKKKESRKLKKESEAAAAAEEEAASRRREEEAAAKERRAGKLQVHESLVEALAKGRLLAPS